eukprot:m.301976 g.301976  ORF g.301976 m.301976 type:complete len:222 (+) comp55228_c0_seq1:169-834(+)
MWRRSTTTSTTDEEEDESLALPGVAAVTSAAPRAIFVRSASSMTPSSSSLSSASPAPTQVFRRHNTIIDSDDDDDENSRNVFRQARAFSDVSRPSDHALAAQRNAASTQRSKDSQPVFRTGVRTESRRDWPGAVSTKEPAKETPLGEKQQEATSMFQPDTRPSVELKADGLSRCMVISVAAVCMIAYRLLAGLRPSSATWGIPVYQCDTDQHDAIFNSPIQ